MPVALKLTEPEEHLILISRPKYLIGRADDCHLRPSSAGVSRHHCAVILEGDEVLVRDLGSSNGTFVNGTRIAGAHSLTSGDLILIGPLKFEVLIENEQAPVATEEDDDDDVILGERSVLGDLMPDSDEAAAARWIEEADPSSDTQIMSGEEAEELRRDLAGRAPDQAPATPQDSSSDAAAEVLRRLRGTKGG